VIVTISIIIGFLTIDPLFRLLGAEGKILGLIKEYMSIWYGGMIFLVVPMVGNGAIRAKGITSIPATIMTVAALANFILDPLLIFGLGPFPALGLKGAALATVFARGVTLLASLYFLIFRLKMIDFKPPTFQVGLKSWKEILRVGAPTAGTNVVLPITISIITSMISKYGYESVAAFGIVSKVQSFAMIVLWGISSSMGPFAGQNYGAGKIDRVLKASFISYGFSIIWGLFIFILLYVFSENIILLFNKNPDVVKVGVLYLSIVPLTYGFEGLRLIGSSTFNGIGKPLAPTMMVLIKVGIIYIPFAFFGSRYFGVKGIFMAEALGNFLIGVLSFILIKKVCSKEKVTSLS
jgi:putative MATE family efflux protein